VNLGIFGEYRKELNKVYPICATLKNSKKN